ncbi:MAG: ABC transporter ATP-binding protein [Sphaerochaeta sp.]
MKLIVKNLSFSYPGKKVLKNIELYSNYKEFICILGPNGSGKSTLVKCIEGLLPTQKDSIFLDGKSVKLLNRVEKAKMIGYVSQNNEQLFADTVFDTVLMGRKPYYSWHCSDEDIEITANVIRHLELEDLAMCPFNELSGGQQQRVIIARALAQEPKILLLDEPTSALDISHQLEVMEILKNLVEDHNISVIMVIHDLNMAARYADKLVLMKDGMIYSQGNANDILTVENLALVYGIESEIYCHRGIVSVSPIKKL